MRQMYSLANRFVLIWDVDGCSANSDMEAESCKETQC